MASGVVCGVWGTFEQGLGKAGRRPRVGWRLRGGFEDLRCLVGQVRNRGREPGIGDGKGLLEREALSHGGLDAAGGEG
jgi:hypothetical protein